MFDIIQAMGGILMVRWVHDGQVIIGPYCIAQGIIKQTGSVGTALITFVCHFPCCYYLSLNLRTLYQILAVHTFITALWGIGINARGVAFSLVGLTCVFIALWVGIGNGIHKNYESPTLVGHFNHYPLILFPHRGPCLHSIGAGSVLDSV
jgi:hypothetical protein